MSATLIAHCGADNVTREQLLEIPEPEAMGTKHKPIPHHQLITTLAAVLANRGVQIAREQFAVGRGGAALFATFDFDKASPGLVACSPDQGHAMGLRGANDKTMSLESACARRIFVCDNMAFTRGLIHFRRKHTTGLDLKAELDGAVVRYLQQTRDLTAMIEAAQEKLVTVEEAKMLIYDAFLKHEVAPTRLLARVHQTYFAPEESWTDIVENHGRLWGLHSAFTRTFQELKPNPRFMAAAKLGGLLALGSQN